MNEKNKKTKKTDKANSAVNAYLSAGLSSDILGSYTGIPIDEELIAKNVSGGKTYIKLHSTNEVPTQDADDL